MCGFLFSCGVLTGCMASLQSESFRSASIVATYVSQMKTADEVRAKNRTLIQDQLNGLPPYTSQEAEDNAIDVNVNWGFSERVAHRARRQFENAFMKPSNFFTVMLRGCKDEKASEWEREITDGINHVMKESLSYTQTIRDVFAAVVMHGSGARIWPDGDHWEAHFRPIEDIMIPTNTELNMRKLPYCATRQPYTYLEIADLIHNKDRDPGWNVKALKELLDSIKISMGPQSGQWNWTDSPEKMAEIMKQNGTAWDTDSVGSIWVWNFFYRDTDRENKWYQCCILDVPGTSAASVYPGNNEFLYEGKKPCADKLSELIHFQFGDGNNKAPAMYHSMRSLGNMLFDTCETYNRLQSQFVQHVFEQITMLFRITDPADRGRTTKVMLLDKGVIPAGVSILGPQERYQVDNSLIQTTFSNFRQIISEAAASFTQDVNDGTSKELTATEVMARVNDINSLISSMLTMAYIYEKPFYRETCRRFCKKSSSDPEVKEFQKQMKEAGVPEKWLDVTRWEIIPEQVLGGGHKMLEQAQAQSLYQMMPGFEPAAQDIVKRIKITADTDNPRLADRLVPKKKASSNDSTHDAELAFGAMMSGSPVQPLPGLNRAEQLKVMLQLMQLRAQAIEQEGAVGTREDVIGLSLCLAWCQELLKSLGADESQSQLVKQAQNVMAKVESQLKAFAQRQQEQAQKQQAQPDPQAVAEFQLEQQKAQFEQQMTVEKLKLETQRLSQMIEASNAQVRAQIEQGQAKTASEQQRKDALAQADIARKDALVASDIQRQNVKAAADISRQQTIAESQVKASRKKAKASGPGE